MHLKILNFCFLPSNVDGLVFLFVEIEPKKQDRRLGDEAVLPGVHGRGKLPFYEKPLLVGEPDEHLLIGLF